MLKISKNALKDLKKIEKIKYMCECELCMFYMHSNSFKKQKI